MPVSILNKVTDDFRQGRELIADEAEALLDALIDTADESVIAGLLTAWSSKGIEENEIYEVAKIMRGRMKRVSSRHETFVDIVGTGGSRAKTFNVSTAAAFVVAGAGLPVAKHGNKAATSNSGSADVLSALGVNSAPDLSAAEQCLNDLDICFMFAPNHHRLSPTLGKVRRGLGFPTIFNCVGPLCNPASAPHQLIGVWDNTLVPKIAGALARLGTTKSWIVYGKNGLDEISVSGSTEVAEVADGSVKRFEVSPGDFNLCDSPLDGIRTDSADRSADLIRGVLSDKLPSTPAESIVLANSAAALYLSGRVSGLCEGFEVATESVRSKGAAAKLEQLREAMPV